MPVVLIGATCTTLYCTVLIQQRVSTLAKYAPPVEYHDAATVLQSGKQGLGNVKTEEILPVCQTRERKNDRFP